MPGAKDLTNIRSGSPIDSAKGANASQNSLRDFAFFYFLTYIMVAIVLLFAFIPFALRELAIQLTPVTIVEVVLVDFPLSIVATPIVMWVARAVPRAQYRRGPL